jgi:hypothetical protein
MINTKPWRLTEYEMPEAGIEPARGIPSQDFKSITYSEHPLPGAKKTKENQPLIVLIFALGSSCFGVFPADIGTKPGQPGHYFS